VRECCWDRCCTDWLHSKFNWSHSHDVIFVKISKCCTWNSLQNIYFGFFVFRTRGQSDLAKAALNDLALQTDWLTDTAIISNNGLHLMHSMQSKNGKMTPFCNLFMTWSSYFCIYYYYFVMQFTFGLESTDQHVCCEWCYISTGNIYKHISFHVSVGLLVCWHLLRSADSCHHDCDMLSVCLVMGHPFPYGLLICYPIWLVTCYCGGPENYQETALKQEYNFSNRYKLCNNDSKTGAKRQWSIIIGKTTVEYGKYGSVQCLDEY